MGAFDPPTMPRFTDPTTGRFSPSRAFGNVLDAFVPFDIYNSQTGRYNRNNAIAGGVSMVNPIAGLGTYAYLNRDELSMPTMPRFSNPFSGGWLAARTGRDPSDRGRRVQAFNADAIGLDAANYVPGTTTLNRSEEQMQRTRNDEGNTDIYSAPRSPSLGGRSYSARPGYGGTVSSQRGLGRGALGSSGNAAVEQYMQALMSRGGTFQER